MHRRQVSALCEARSCFPGSQQHRAGHGAGLRAGRAWHAGASLSPSMRVVIPSALLASAGTHRQELVGLRVKHGKCPHVPFPAPRPTEANSSGYRWKTHFQPSPPVAPRSLEKSRDSSLYSEGCGRFLSCRMSFFSLKRAGKYKNSLLALLSDGFGSAVSRRSGARRHLPSIGAAAARCWQVAVVEAGSV